MFKKTIYAIIAALFILLWGVTAFAQTDANQNVTFAGLIHHRQPKLNLPSQSPDPLANYKTSAATKEVSVWILGASAIFLVLCPIAAWEITVPRQSASRR